MIDMPLILFLLISLFSIESADAVRTDHVEAELVSENMGMAPGSESWVGLRLVTEKHWHVYWKSPGDSGLPTKVQWELPPGWKISGAHWEIPSRIVLFPLVNYGYEGESLIGFRVQPPKNARGKYELQAKASWLVCKEECIPEKADLKFAVEVGANTARNSWAGAFESLRAQQPQVIPPGEIAMLVHDESKLTLELSNLSAWLGKKRDFFPYPEQMLKGLEPPKSRETDVGVRLQMEKASPFNTKLERFSGMLVVDGSRAYEIDLAMPEMVTNLDEREPTESLLLSLFLAFVGGLILNLMPCVFPVLGIKAMSLVRLAESQRGEARMAGLAYTAGILVSFWALSLGIVALRSAGVAAGWGFQLQSPAFVSALVLIFVLMGWNMLGIFEIGGRWTGAGSALAGKDGPAGSFFTGVLAVVVASPCTAPFMGAAVAAVIGAPMLTVLGVFTMLGFGLAFPFLLLSFAPSLRVILPRPGAWMESFKQVLAFPLFATVIWLLWVLEQQVGANGLLIMIVASLLLSFGVWIRYKWKNAGWSFVVMLSLFAVSAFAAVSAPLIRDPSLQRKGELKGNWVPYDEAVLQSALKDGRPVFIDFTAAWCLSCQVNKAAVLETAEIQDFFKQQGVLLMRGDYTNEDPLIAKALAGYNSASVPLYVVYAPKSRRPQILSSILTRSMVKNAYLKGDEK